MMYECETGSHFSKNGTVCSYSVHICAILEYMHCFFFMLAWLIIAFHLQDVQYRSGNFMCLVKYQGSNKYTGGKKLMALFTLQEKCHIELQLLCKNH